MSFHKRPNLFIIGAPKCGTTSLHAYLGQHPQVFMSEPKEPNHFAYADNNPYGWDSRCRYAALDAYLSLFEASGSADIVGESSTCYSLMPQVPKAICAHNPEAKIVAVLRNPVERAWSMYLYWHQFESTSQPVHFVDFRKRFIADDLPTHHAKSQTRRVEWLRGASMYWSNLSYYFDVFPHEQIKLVSYDEYAKQPQACLNDLCQFLGVTEFKFDTSVKLNTTVNPRFRSLYNFTNLQVNHPLRRAIKKGLGNLVPLRMLRQAVNRSIHVKLQLPNYLYNELIGYFHQDLERLRHYTGFTVDSWLRPR